MHERFDAERVLAALRDPAGPTLVSLVPTTLTRLLDAGLREPPALRWALLGGAAIPPALLERAAARRRPGRADLRHDRGVLADPHERRAAVLHARARSDAAARSWSRGRRCRRTRARSCTPATSAASDADGRVVVLGRADDMIISGGENVAPAGVEAVLEQHPAVAEAAVHGRPDERWGQAVVATRRARAPGARLAPWTPQDVRRASAATRLRAAGRSPEGAPRVASDASCSARPRQRQAAAPRTRVVQRVRTRRMSYRRMDAEAYRADSRDSWEQAAERLDRAARARCSARRSPVSERLVERAAPAARAGRARGRRRASATRGCSPPSS